MSAVTPELETMIRDIHAVICFRPNGHHQPAIRRVAKRAADAALDRYCGMVGVPPSLIQRHCREKWLVDARTVIAVRMRQEGWTQSDIGRAMRRDHAAIANLEARFGAHRDTQAIQELWDRVNNHQEKGTE